MKRIALVLSLLAPAFLAPGANALVNARFAHTTTLMPDGNILVTGGVTNTNTRTASVEMYYMSANAYVAWPDTLDTPRSSHTATLMSDGRVLIAGGFTGGGTPSSDLEICTPITGACNLVANMAIPRGGHTATLLSKGTGREGRVLLCGGQTTVANGVPVVASSASVTNTCELFNPADDTVSNIDAADMVSPRVGHAATLLGSGRVFVTGGVRAGAQGSPQWVHEPNNEIFDPVANTWTPVSALLQGRIDHTATVLNNGTVMIAGGYNAKNSLYCLANENSLEEDCWHIKYPANGQNSGTQGYIDGAEFFDQNGARVALIESTLGEMPYRAARHTAVLGPTGKWELYGGYGNIFPTFFTDSPTLSANSVINLQTVAGSSTTATIVPAGTVIEFDLDFSLSKPVSGRLVEADAFISPPQGEGTPAVQLRNVKFNMTGPTTARADGKAVGLLLGPDTTFKPGDFKSTMRLYQPAGTAVFEPHGADSGADPDFPTMSINSSLTLSGQIYPGTTGAVTGGTLRTAMAFRMPDIYTDRIMGRAQITGGAINHTGGHYSITLNPTGATTFNLGPATNCDADSGTCLFTGALTFSGVTGQIANQTLMEDVGNNTTFYSPLNVFTTGQVNLALQLSYTANEVTIGDKEPAYNFSRSTFVVRGMIFNSKLEYYPAANTWGALADDKDEDTMATPSFSHTTMLTPASDRAIIGGANCEFNPADDCLRAAPRFSTAAVQSTFIPVYRGKEGANAWTTGDTLNSKRAFHTSTLLPGGKILTCGGSDGVRPLASCELLDPATREWVVTGSMISPRANHTATLLPNGNVLIAGGMTPEEPATATAEIFYPDTQRWVATSSMTLPRQLHTATLLPNGNVLVAGGTVAGAYSDSAVIYISSTGYWMNGLGGVMLSGRAEHTATLLKNGRVLLAGGMTATGPTKKTEVYDYIARTVTAGPDMLQYRYAHTANQLRDGNVLVTGGSDGHDSLRTSEIYTGAAWAAETDLNYNRANHSTVLLPNGKVMLTGGEVRGAANTIPESFDPDFRSWAKQGEASPRTHHTSLLTQDNRILNIGGWDGGAYLDTTEFIDFNFYPDMSGLEAATTRQAVISTGTLYFNQGWRATLTSDASNFHGITEASGGGAGAMNASYHNPRLYMQQIDNPSGFLIDLSTRIYSAYAAANPNPSWEKTLSSITIITPDLPGVMPHGWYHMRVAAAGVFSQGFVVQVTTPRPTGLTSVPVGQVLGTSSITWTWDRGTIPADAADGYTIYSATNNVFIATAAFTTNASYNQTGMVPNTAASIMVTAYNLGGPGPLVKSATYYTLAATPRPLEITEASFETARLEWARNNNSELTTYEVSMSPARIPKFSDPLAISTPVPFSVNYMSTSTVITQLSANQLYDFRVRARNGAGIETEFSTSTAAGTPASTITVSGVNNFSGQALSSSTINWAWDESIGADYYELYDVTSGTATSVFIGSTTSNTFTQMQLSANIRYYASVQAVNDTAGSGPIRGPQSAPVGVYTLTVQPLPGVPNVFSNVSTGTLTVNWITNGNSTNTHYVTGLSAYVPETGVDVFITSRTSIENSRAFNTLLPNVRYKVTLTPINGDNIPGTTMDLGSKYTLARVPDRLVPYDISMSGISLFWDTLDNSEETIYEVRGSTSDAFAEPVLAYVPFASAYTDNTALVTGLLTGTSYYFDVAARNGEGFVTARKRSLAAFTLPGPNGAPTGSIGGTSDPSAATTITGTLPNGRVVALNIPAGSFASATQIAISSSATNVCGWLAGGLLPVEVAIFSENNAQPQEPVTLTLKFDQDPITARNDIINKAAQLVVARYNPVSGQCLPLETRVNVGERTITATLNHFSVFQLMVRTAATNLANVIVYPNPFYANRGQGFVTIDRLPASAKVRVYTLSGDKVWEGSAGTTGVVIWRGTNKSGNLVASGVYLAVIDSSAGKKVLKIAVER
jgi:hypothetical protein